jgi:tRNA threonylcarbamoyladenosine biosynthesis protein TsaE
MPTTLPRTLSFTLEGEDATVQLGREVGAHLPPGAVVWLHGELGAGKTTFTRGVLQALGHEGAVKSPTYTLVEPYENVSGGPLYHFDLYRLGDATELEYLGLGDYTAAGARLLFEWPERGGNRLPPAQLSVRLTVVEGGREAQLTAHVPELLPTLAHLRL